jgi:hypothetical protein
MTTTLTPFDGREVTGLSAIITKTGDGLSDALEVDPVESHIGSRRTVALDVYLKKVRFDPIKDTTLLRRVEIWEAEGATFVDRAVVSEALDAMAQRIEEARGVQRLPLDDALDEDEADEEPLTDAEEKARDILDGKGRGQKTS